MMMTYKLDMIGAMSLMTASFSFNLSNALRAAFSRFTFPTSKLSPGGAKRGKKMKFMLTVFPFFRNVDLIFTI
jgi:hypothetical protein